MRAAGTIAIAVIVLVVLAWKLCFVTTPTAAPALSKQWHEQVYGLDEDEVLRFIPPPYSPARMKAFARGWAGAPPKKETGQLVYHELRTRTQHWGMSSAAGDVKSALEYTSRLAVAQLDIAPEVRKLPADGDWILRIGISTFDTGDQPVERRMTALQSILSAVTRRNLLIQKRTVEKDVIIASGRWTFQPITGGRRTSIPAIHFYTDTLDPQQGAGGGSGDLNAVFHRVEEITHRTLIDEVTRRPVGEVPCRECFRHR